MRARSKKRPKIRQVKVKEKLRDKEQDFLHSLYQLQNPSFNDVMVLLRNVIVTERIFEYVLARKFNKEILELCLGAKIATQKIKIDFNLAVRSGYDVPCLQLLISHGAKLNSETLEYALSSNVTCDVMNFLIKQKAFQLSDVEDYDRDFHRDCHLTSLAKFWIDEKSKPDFDESLYPDFIKLLSRYEPSIFIDCLTQPFKLCKKQDRFYSNYKGVSSLEKAREDFELMQNLTFAERIEFREAQARSHFQRFSDFFCKSAQVFPF
jgi:hypothetical protein